MIKILKHIDSKDHAPIKYWLQLSFFSKTFYMKLINLYGIKCDAQMSSTIECIHLFQHLSWQLYLPQ